MKIRLGYVAISNVLGRKVTSSSNVTYSNYQKILSVDKKKEKLISVTASNLNALQEIIRYNIKNDIHFYRITSALIPLVTHPEVGYWGHREIFKKDFEYIGKLIRESEMRVDTHPDEFNVINSVNPQVVKNTEINLMRQVEWFEDMNYIEGKMVVHIGGATGGKIAGIERFKANFKTLPESIKTRIIVENDDKSYTAKETLELCKDLNIPMVLDVHHHRCNNDGEVLEDMLMEVFDTWKDEKIPPKVHFSSPKEGPLDKKHADFINVYDFLDFIKITENINRNFDIMLECKEKDVALFQLVSDIKEVKSEYKWIDKSTLMIKLDK